MNKRGAGEELALFMFLTIMIIFLTGVVLGTRSFFGQGYDFRPVEVDQIREKLLSCFALNDFFAPGFSLIKSCGVNEKFFDSDHVLIFRSFPNGDKSFIRGVSDYENQCQFIGGKTNRAYPVCVSGQIVKGGEKFYFVIGSNQQARQGVA